jgi:hypothetical protein
MGKIPLGSHIGVIYTVSGVGTLDSLSRLNGAYLAYMDRLNFLPLMSHESNAILIVSYQMISSVRHLSWLLLIYIRGFYHLPHRNLRGVRLVLLK